MMKNKRTGEGGNKKPKDVCGWNRSVPSVLLLTSALDVPHAAAQGVQAQLLRHLRGGHGLGQVLLVGEHLQRARNTQSHQTNDSYKIVKDGLKIDYGGIVRSWTKQLYHV